jgi:folate-binding protein YgfZ
MSRYLAPITPELVWFTGADAIRFLDDLISQEIGSAEPGEVRRSLLLTAQGKIDFILWALRDEERVGLVTEDGRGEELIARLARYRIRVEVEISAEERPTALVVGGDDRDPGRWVEGEGGLFADVSWPDLTRVLRVGEIPAAPVMSETDYTTARIEAGEPLAGVDVTDSTIPQETGLVPAAISFSKGCFLGQELVARLDSRGGRVNHHLRILRFHGPAPAVGGWIETDGEAVGVLTTAAGEVGLALLGRGVQPGDVVRAGGVEAVVEAVPGS